MTFGGVSFVAVLASSIQRKIQSIMKAIETSKIDILDEHNSQLNKLDAQRDHSNKTLRAEEELARLFTQSLDLLCIAGTDGYFRRLNPAWVKLLGWSLDELLAKPFLNFVHPHDRDSTIAAVESLADGEETILFENRYLHRNGTYLWLQWNAKPEPETNLIFAAARDITRQRELEQEVLEISDREKEHLGQELHDGLCQKLAGIAALSMTLSRSLNQKYNYTNSVATESDSAAEIARLLGDALRDARDLARGLNPVGLAEFGLTGALEVLTVNVQHIYGVKCILDIRYPSITLPSDVETHLFRITQEAVNNAIRHGCANIIDITLSLDKAEGLLSVSDDGIGLTESALLTHGLGLHTMSYRARLIGGSLTIKSRTPNGSCVSCNFSVLSPKTQTMV